MKANLEEFAQKICKSLHKISLIEAKLDRFFVSGTLLLESLPYYKDLGFTLESKQIKKILQKTFSFPKQESEILLEVVEEQAKHGFDFHEVVTETNQINHLCLEVESLDEAIAHIESQGVELSRPKKLACPRRLGWFAPCRSQSGHLSPQFLSSYRPPEHQNSPPSYRQIRLYSPKRQL